MHKVAIITARSGSKGLKDKNIISLCDKPLMAYSIEAALQTESFDRIIVSTDAERYGQIAQQYGAEVMYRGEALSDDNATSYMVLADVLKRLDTRLDYFVLLQPTSPLRTSQHIREAVTAFENHICDFDFLVSVKEAKHTSALVKPIEADLSLKHFDLDYSSYRRQTSKEYSPNGAIFMGKPQEYLKQRHFFGKRSMAYIMSELDSIDIDYEIDLKFAQLVMEEKMREKR